MRSCLDAERRTPAGSSVCVHLPRGGASIARMLESATDPFAQIALFYDLDLEGFDDDLALYLELAEEAAKRGGSEDVLELGCGTGRVAAALAGAGFGVPRRRLQPRDDRGGASAHRGAARPPHRGRYALARTRRAVQPRADPARRPAAPRDHGGDRSGVREHRAHLAPAGSPRSTSKRRTRTTGCRARARWSSIGRASWPASPATGR